jgi:hypothetical protein
LTKAWITGLVVLGALLVFTVILPFFFGGRSNRYDKSSGSIAQRKKD